MKEYLTKEYFNFVLMKAISIVSFALFFYFSFIIEEPQILLSIIFIFIAFITLYKSSYTDKKQSRPKLSRCLDKANFLESFLIPMMFHLSAYIVVFYLADFILRQEVIEGALPLIAIFLIIISALWYFKGCKKYGVIGK